MLLAVVIMNMVYLQSETRVRIHGTPTITGFNPGPAPAWRCGVLSATYAYGPVCLPAQSRTSTTRR